MARYFRKGDRVTWENWRKAKAFFGAVPVGPLRVVAVENRCGHEGAIHESENTCPEPQTQLVTVENPEGYRTSHDSSWFTLIF